MQERIDWKSVAPDAFAAQLGLETYARRAGLPAALLELVKTRASQINGCAYCLDMHTTALRAGGTPQVKLDSLAGWRVSSHFSERERAALAWAESLVNVADTHAPDEDFAPLKEHFSDVEISDLCFAVALMSAFNRLAIGVRQ